MFMLDAIVFITLIKHNQQGVNNAHIVIQRRFKVLVLERNDQF